MLLKEIVIKIRQAEIVQVHLFFLKTHALLSFPILFD